MKKIKKKIFLVIFFMLTMFLLSILTIFNYQSYNQEKEGIQTNLMRMEDDKNIGEQPKPNDLNEDNSKNIEENKLQPIFMDMTVYTVFYNNENKIIDIINHTQNNITEEEISEIAEEILNQNDKKEGTSIGNLYFDKYSYTFKGYNSLTIIDNSNVKNKLINLLKTSIIIFILAEIIIIVVSIKLTSWIIKPVIESFNKQKQFIADASHELKTPIAVIMANAEALENEPNERKWLNNIKNEAERMNELVTDLLDLARLENDVSKENFQVENLSKIVEKTILTFESIMYEKKIKLEYDIKENINIVCNNNQIKQLLVILIDNAIQHSKENGEIKVTLRSEKNDVALNVTNKGKEIPKDMYEKIFERFYRVDESRNRNTNRYGLGLAIAKNIVINHNGKINVQSENGYTTFIVKLNKASK